MEALLNRMRKQGGFYCYNLSRGAKIEGADPLPVDDVMITDSTFDKEIVVRSIYDTFTRSAPESLINETPESVLHLEHFLEALDYLKQGWDDRIQTREDLCQLLWRYHRTLYLMKATDRRVIYDLLKGSYTAAAYQMLSIAFMVPDEAEAITRAREVYDIWCQYMNEMPDMVRQASSFIDEGDEHLIRNYNG